MLLLNNIFVHDQYLNRILVFFTILILDASKFQIIKQLLHHMQAKNIPILR